MNIDTKLELDRYNIILLERITICKIMPLTLVGSVLSVTFALDFAANFCEK